MHLSNESLLIILFLGLVAGWLSGEIMRGYGFGLIGDIVIGVIGAFIGLLPRLGIHLGAGLISAIAKATIGAVVLFSSSDLFAAGPAGLASRFLPALVD